MRKRNRTISSSRGASSPGVSTPRPTRGCLFESGQDTYVLKELPERLALREYRLLRELIDKKIPAASPIGVVADRGEALHDDAILITRHVDFSLPYRVLFAGRGLKIPFLGERLLDALVGLLVRLHLAGFYWGDCSLSNTLFRRDAGALVAFVIDVETSELHPRLSDGQRETDLTIATENVAGGLFDLAQSGHLADDIDPIETSLDVRRRYTALWSELTEAEVFPSDDEYRVDERLNRLHRLGFDVSEIELASTPEGTRVRLTPRVVESGYYAPQLASLTGLATGENQARRLLNEIHTFSARHGKTSGRRLSEAVAATRWLDNVYEPTIETLANDLDGKLEPAEAFHQLLEHRWFMSEQAGADVGHDQALRSYIADVLLAAPDERMILETDGAD